MRNVFDERESAAGGTVRAAPQAMRFLFVLLLLPALAWAEPATTIRQVDMKKAPAADADTIGQLDENTAVDALERKGGWTRVKSAKGEGWVRMLALRFGGPGAARQGDSGVTRPSSPSCRSSRRRATPPRASPPRASCRRAR
jgi:hypothetical protein